MAETVEFDIDEAVKAYEADGKAVKGQEVVIFPTHVEVKMADGTVKCISTGDFSAVLTGTLQAEVQAASILLPANCYYWSQTLNDLKLSCYYPGRVRPITHIARDNSATGNAKPAKYDIPFPNVVISHKFKRANDKWDWKESKYLATSKTIAQLPLTFLWNVEAEEQIWPLPVSNMYEDGRMCYGSNSIPRMFKDNFRGLDWHFAILYNSPFNDDLGVHGTASVRRSVTEWYKELAIHKTFPYELMKHGKKVVPETKSVSSNIYNVEIEA
jgi:hypothetical protein